MDWNKEFERAEKLVNTGHYEEGDAIFARMPKLSDDPELIARAIHNRGNIALDQSEYTKARKFYEKELTLCKGKTRQEAYATFQICRIFQAQGYLEEAEHYAVPAIEFLRQQHDPNVAIGYNLLGCLYWQLGGEGKSFIEKSIRMKEKLKNKAKTPEEEVNIDRGIAASLCIRSLMWSDRSSMKAQYDVDHAFLTYQTAKDEYGMAMTSYAIGRYLERNANLPMYFNMDYKVCIDLCSKLHLLKGKAVALQGLARIQGKQAYHKEAVRIFKKLECNPKHIPKTKDSLDNRLECFV